MKVLTTAGVRTPRRCEPCNLCLELESTQFGTFMTKCHPIVEELAASVTNPEVWPTSFATSALRGLRRTLEEITGAVDNAEAGTTVEEECPVQKLACEPGQTSYDEATGLPLDPKMVADPMRKLQVYLGFLRVTWTSLDGKPAEHDGSTRARVMPRIHSSEQD